MQPLHRLGTAIRRALALAGLAAFLAAGAGAGDRTLAVYDPQHRSAAELLPLARVALGGEGEAMVDAGTNQLVLVGNERALAETVALLRKQDRAPRSVVLRYESERLDSLEARGLRVDWNVDAGAVRVGNVRSDEVEDVPSLCGIGRAFRDGGARIDRPLPPWGRGYQDIADPVTVQVPGRPRPSIGAPRRLAAPHHPR